MNYQFDELTKSMAKSVTRRAALKKFGVGLAGMALACFGLANRAEAKKPAQCYGSGVFCGTGSLSTMPAQCLTLCCSHNAYPSGGIDNQHIWRCS